MMKEVDDEEREMEEEVQLEVEKLDEKRKAKVATEMKEKGNEHFKNSGFEAAIQCYTTGMQADPTNPVFPANRAMAFLKLKRYTETEADCTLALSLDPSYTKAYLRRGSARVALGKSSSGRKDFMDALKLEPGNPQAKAEIKKLDKLENVQRTKPIEPHKVNGSMANSKKKSKYVYPILIPAKLRSKKPLMRVEVQEIGFEEPSKTNGSVSKAELDAILDTANEEKTTEPEGKGESSKPLISMIPDGRERLKDEESGKIPTKLKDESNVEKPKVHPMAIDFDKEEKVWARPWCYANGINGEANSSRTDVPPMPTTSFQFQAQVRQLANSHESLYKYILQISPSHIPTLIKEQLETSTLMPIVKCFKNSTSYETVYQYLTQFAKVRRFEMAVMFLSDREKNAAREVFNQLEENLPEKRGSIKILSRKYGL